MKMSDLPVDNGTILVIKGIEVIIRYFGGVGDDRAYAVPVKGMVSWRGKEYKAGRKVGMPLTALDVQRGLEAHQERASQSEEVHMGDPSALDEYEKLSGLQASKCGKSSAFGLTITNKWARVTCEKCLKAQKE